MADDSGAAGLRGNDLLSRISTEMVRAQKKYFGKGPESTKSYMLDDFLLIVMRGNQTVAERSMIEFGQETRVRDFRQHFENEMTTRLVDMIEELTGRKVLGYQSQMIFAPDVVVELFFFDREAEEPGVGEARADAADDDVGGDIQADHGDSTDDR